FLAHRLLSAASSTSSGPACPTMLTVMGAIWNICNCYHDAVRRKRRGSGSPASCQRSLRRRPPGGSGSRHMRKLAHTPPPGGPVHSGPIGRLWRLAHVLEVAMAVRRERRMLLGMDNRALKDMGFNRGEAYAEAQRPFWDIPADRLGL